jgi:hypothetical protein
MKAKILILFLIFIMCKTTYTRYDLLIGGYDIFVHVTMRTVSIPFEGVNDTKEFNRNFLDFNGSIHRRYSGQNDYQECQIMLLEGDGSLIATSCWFEEFQTYQVNCYGFAKYLIDIVPNGYPEREIAFLALPQKIGQLVRCDFV